MEDLASRVTTRVQITTDGHRAYAEAVEGAFGLDVDYAMLIKLYGTPDPRHISTSFIERQNLICVWVFGVSRG
jgi:hypothetical protein